MRRALLIAAAVLAVAAAPSPAAEPADGTVSASSPTVAWTGTLVRPYLHHNVFFYEPPGTLPCTEPACDTFTLEVADSFDLVLTVESEQTNDMSLRIQKPDGSWEYFEGWSDSSKPTRVTFRKAATGTYTINIVARVFGSNNPTAVEDSADYTGTAELKVPPPPAAAPQPPPAAEPPAATKPKRKTSRNACRKRAKKIRNAKKRRAALKRCARRR